MKKFSRKYLKEVQGGKKLTPARDMCYLGENDECKAYGLECGIYVTNYYSVLRCV
ncbi:hypothetical protein HZQ72_15020 [Elizabethkingia anophelis]|nr:hypothetical protein [Elizabethkingia anophelis]